MGVMQSPYSCLHIPASSFLLPYPCFLLFLLAISKDVLDITVFIIFSPLIETATHPISMQSDMSQTEKLDSLSYKPPSKGILSYLPSSWVPYAELIRLHKPAGILYIYFPYLFGSLFAASLEEPIPSPDTIVTSNVLLFVVAFVLRSVGCTWNDIVDRDLDRQVACCRIRPIARGALSVRAGYIATAAQYLILFAVMVPSSPKSLPYLVPVIATGTLYPYAKRVNNYAQGVLGLSLSMGMFVGCAVMGMDPQSLGLSKSFTALLSLAVSYMVWTMIYDTIYAFQDIRDDEKAGIKAMSIWHQGHMKPLLFSLSLIQIGLLVYTGTLIHAG